jgi:hypothetical protein
MAEASAAATVEATATYQRTDRRNRMLIKRHCQDTRNTILALPCRRWCNTSVPTEPTHAPQATAARAPRLRRTPRRNHHKKSRNGRVRSAKYEIIRAAIPKFRLETRLQVPPTQAGKGTSTQTCTHPLAATRCLRDRRVLWSPLAEDRPRSAHAPGAGADGVQAKNLRGLMSALTRHTWWKSSPRSPLRSARSSARLSWRELRHQELGQYWKLWIQCGVAMQNVYRMSHELPETLRHMPSNAIELLHPDTSMHLTAHRRPSTGCRCRATTKRARRSAKWLGMWQWLN